MSDTTETQRTFSKAEHDAFDRYAQRLIDLLPPADRDGVILARDGGACAVCGLRVPPGVPMPLVGTDRAVCPSCVFARSMDKAIMEEFESCATSVDDGVRARLFASTRAITTATQPRTVGDAMRAKRGPIDDTIKRLRDALGRSTTDDERSRLVRLLVDAESRRNGGRR